MTKKNETVVAEVEAVAPATPHTQDAGEIRKKSSFGRTFYYIDTKRQRLGNGPNQMLGLVKWMIEKGITSPQKAMNGAEIGQKAIEDGFVATAKLTGPVIFAYYARRMEKEQGMEHAKTLHAKTGKQMN